MLPAVRTLIPGLLFATLLACAGGCDSADTSPPTKAPAPSNATPQLEVKPAAARPATRKERPLPAFSGWTLEDERLSVSSLLGKRLLLFFFNPEVASVSSAATGVASISSLQREFNFEIVGIAVGSSRDSAKAFVRKHRFGFEVIDDSSGAISKRLGLRSPISVIGVDGEGYVVFGFGTLPNDAAAVEGQLRSALRLPASEGSKGTGIENGRHPIAPAFEAMVLDQSEKFSLEAHRGNPVVLIFFLHTCPHCHEALKTLKTILEDLPDKKRPAVVGVEISGRTGPVRSMVREMDLDYLSVAFVHSVTFRLEITQQTRNCQHMHLIQVSII